MSGMRGKSGVMITVGENLDGVLRTLIDRVELLEEKEKEADNAICALMKRVQYLEDETGVFGVVKKESELRDIVWGVMKRVKNLERAAKGEPQDMSNSDPCPCCAGSGRVF